jgi:RND family efflux transporter MFP subunit
MMSKIRLSALLVALCIGAIVSITSLKPAFAQDRSENTSFKGIVAPARSYDISPPVDGQVIKIHFVPGQFVEKGALLFTLDATKEELELDRDRARLLRAEAKFRVAEVILKSNTELREKNVISERQFVELEAARDVAAADLAEAQVQVHGDEVKIKELKRYAPFAGIMSRSTVAEGAHLIRQARENTGMATITELDPIQVKANVPYEVYADHLKLLKLEGKGLGTEALTESRSL